MFWYYFVVPDKVIADVKVIAPGIVATVSVICADGMQWETNIITKEWQAVPPEYSFQPQLLFDPQAGIQSVIANDLFDLQYVGISQLEEVPGIDLYHLEAKLSGKQTSQITFGLIDDEELSITLWINPNTYELYRIIVIDPMNEGDDEDTIWTIDFWDFDNVIDISPPI